MSFGLLIQQGFSQISLETVYQVSGSVTQLENSGYKYFVMDWVNNQCRIYNMDHSVWKVINLTVPSGYYLYDIRYVSEKLFDGDNLVELALTYYYYDETGQYYIYGSKIVNEVGEDLVVIPGASCFEVFDTGTNGPKFLAYVYDYSIFPYTVQTWVYDLPDGTNPNSVYTSSGFNLQSFPNPAQSFVTLLYALPEKSEGAEIQLMDIRGKVLKSYPVDRASNSLQINISMFPKGIYLYRVTGSNYISENYKLIIQ
jgi:hypothetical protein